MAWANRGRQARQGPDLLEAPATVVGVVRHLRHRTLTAEVREQVYVSVRQSRRNPMVYVVRTSGDPSAALAPIRALVRDLDAQLPIYDERPLTAYVMEARAARRFTLTLVAVFAAVALALAAVGVYGVIAVTSRAAPARVRCPPGARRPAGPARPRCSWRRDASCGDRVGRRAGGRVCGGAGARGSAFRRDAARSPDLSGRGGSAHGCRDRCVRLARAQHDTGQSCRGAAGGVAGVVTAGTSMERAGSGSEAAASRLRNSRFTRPGSLACGFQPSRRTVSRIDRRPKSSAS